MVPVALVVTSSSRIGARYTTDGWPKFPAMPYDARPGVEDRRVRGPLWALLLSNSLLTSTQTA